MKAPTHTLRSSILLKMTMTFLGVLIPLYGLNLVMNEFGSDAVKTEIVNSMNTKVELYVNLIESDFNRVINLLQALVNDRDLMKLSISESVMSEIEKTEAILSLKSKLDLVKTSSRFVYNVSAFIPALDRTVTSNDDAITNFNEEQFQQLSKVTNRDDWPFLLWNDRLFISVPYPVYEVTDRDREPVFLLTVEVSANALQSALQQFTTNGEIANLAGKRLPWSVSSLSIPVEFDTNHYLGVSKDSERLNTVLSIYVPENEVFGPLKRYRYWLYALTFVAICVTIFFASSIYRIIQRPMRTLVRSLTKVERGNLNFVLKYPLKDEFGFLYDRFNAMVKELNILVHEVYEQKYRVRLAELRQLQSQINPHFLYNSFFLLHRMATLHDNDNIIRFTKYLGEYFQFITRDGTSEIALETEVKHARTYTEIQAFRFANRIRTQFEELPEGMGQMRVPRLILQPLIENAYNHGLENKAKDGWIRISFQMEDTTLVVVVEDNGEELNEEKLNELIIRLRTPEISAESTGLINVHRRIQIMYGQASGVTVSLGDSGGLKVELRLPLYQEVERHVPIVDRR